VGTGRDVSVIEVAERLSSLLDVEIEPRLAGKYRAGDIRNCFADVARARELIGFEPRVTLEQGMAELADWLQGQIPVDRFEVAERELAARGLTL
jgi:dTDP-L-rhamnose 4-epimerase